MCSKSKDDIAKRDTLSGRGSNLSLGASTHDEHGENSGQKFILELRRFDDILYKL